MTERSGRTNFFTRLYDGLRLLKNYMKNDTIFVAVQIDMKAKGRTEIYAKGINDSRIVKKILLHSGMQINNPKPSDLNLVNEADDFLANIKKTLEN